MPVEQFTIVTKEENFMSRQPNPSRCLLLKPLVQLTKQKFLKKKQQLKLLGKHNSRQSGRRKNYITTVAIGSNKLQQKQLHYTLKEGSQKGREMVGLVCTLLHQLLIEWELPYIDLSKG
eukprot:gene8326-871_t